MLMLSFGRYIVQLCAVAVELLETSGGVHATPLRVKMRLLSHGFGDLLSRDFEIGLPHSVWV